MKNIYFNTTNFYLASFIFAKGVELLNIDRITDRRRAIFVFADSSRAEELAHDFNYSKEDDEEVLVDSRKLIQSIKSLKEKLYQNN